MEPTVDLFYSRCLGLILPLATGVSFSNQVGGHACNHPEAEGLFIPLDDGCEQATRKALAHHFTGSWHSLSDEDVAVIDDALQRGNLGFIRVDRARLDDSVEAWVHVILDMKAAPLLSGFDPESNRAVLTWENSD